MIARVRRGDATRPNHWQKLPATADLVTIYSQISPSLHSWCFVEWWPNSLGPTAFLSLRACIGRHNSRLGHGWKNLWSFLFKRHTSTFNSAWKVTQTGLNFWFNFFLFYCWWWCAIKILLEKNKRILIRQVKFGALIILGVNSINSNPAKHQHDCQVSEDSFRYA